MPAARRPFVPKAEQMALWPEVSGNAINGLGESQASRPRPVYWHKPEMTPHGPLQKWFYTQSPEVVAEARALRQKVIDMPLAPLAGERAALSAAQWVSGVKTAAREAGADDVGIALMRPEWVFEGYQVKERWIIIIAVAHEYEKIKTAPEPAAAAEVIRQYARGNFAAKSVASWIRSRGHEALPHGGPMAGPAVLIPPAIEAGLGELGKHGSLIHRRLGSSFRLASVLTDIPLVADAPDRFGADEFCLHCKVCSQECPPDAIFESKQVVRGTQKWYVDFDKCLPYFNEHQGCAICIAVCPWSLPGVAPGLVAKMARRLQAGPLPES